MSGVAGERGWPVSGTEAGPGREPEVRIELRPIGTPLSLGFTGLAIATSTLACLNLGWLPTTSTSHVGLVLLGFAAPLQALATWLSFAARDTPTGSGFGVQAASWTVAGLTLLDSPAGSRSATLGIVLLAAAAGLVPSILTAGIGKLVPAAVMATTAIRFVLTGLYEKLGGAGLERAAGGVGIFLAVLALYTALAVDLEAARGRTVLPLGRRSASPGPAAPAPDIGEVEREPGVRPTL